MSRRVVTAALAVPAAAFASLATRTVCLDHGSVLSAGLGLTHSESGCASGMALGPSLAQLLLLATVLVAGLAGNSMAVREAARAIVERLAPLVASAPVRTSAVVAGSPIARPRPGVVCGRGSRDPPLF